jgi:hypothetical protein
MCCQGWGRGEGVGRLEESRDEQLGGSHIDIDIDASSSSTTMWAGASSPTVAMKR